MFNAIDLVFDYAVKLEKGFALPDIIKILKRVEDFPFTDWKKYGSGSAAEIQAANDFKISLELRLRETDQGKDGSIRL